MRIALIPLEGGRPVELGRDLTLVGRSQEADLKLDHKSVSKLHCVLVRKGDGLLVRDLGSTNGTRINGQRIRRGSLVTDDLLNLAHYTFRIEIGDPSQKKKSPSSGQPEENATIISDYSGISHPQHQPIPSSNGSGMHYEDLPKPSGKASKAKRDSSVEIPELPKPPPPPVVRSPLPDTYDD